MPWFVPGSRPGAVGAGLALLAAVFAFAGTCGAAGVGLQPLGPIRAAAIAALGASEEQAEATVDPLLAVFSFFVPAFAQVTVSNMANLLSRSHGYRNFATPDKSTNNAVIAILGWGEGWHNNHHSSPRAWNFGRKWWEVDISAMVINLMIRAGIASLPPSLAGEVGEKRARPKAIDRSSP